MDCLISGVLGRPDQKEQAMMDTTEIIALATGEIIDEQQLVKQAIRVLAEPGRGLVLDRAPSNPPRHVHLRERPHRQDPRVHHRLEQA